MMAFGASSLVASPSGLLSTLVRERDLILLVQRSQWCSGRLRKRLPPPSLGDCRPALARFVSSNQTDALATVARAGV